MVMIHQDSPHETITCILNLSKELTINKCTLLDCTNTEILTYCINLQYCTFGTVIFTHTLLVQTHPFDVSAPCSQSYGRVLAGFIQILWWSLSQSYGGGLAGFIYNPTVEGWLVSNINRLTSCSQQIFKSKKCDKQL